MKKLIFAICIGAIVTGAANAMNDTARMVRMCEGLFVSTSDNYVLKCPRNDQILALIADEHQVPKFFVADNQGDIKGTFLDKIPNDGEFVFVNVVGNLPDPRYENQTCYRFITEKDIKRDGFYAVEVCEYERPDSYL